MEKGMEKKAKEMALEMLANGESVAKICKYTKLTPEQVKALKRPSAQTLPR